MEVGHCLVRLGFLEPLLVSENEFIDGTLCVRQLHVEVGMMPEVVGQGDLKLMMNMLDLFSGALLREDGAQEELGEAVETFVEAPVQNVEVVVRGRHRSECVP